MAKNGEAAAKPAAGQGAGLALAILLGGGLGVLLLLLLTPFCIQNSLNDRWCT